MSASFVFIWIVWLLLRGIVASEDDYFLARPYITPTTGYATLELKSNFSIDCVANYPITWNPFKGFNGTSEIYYEQTTEQYQSRIYLYNISHYYVGVFYCVSNSTQFDHDYSLHFEANKTFNQDTNGVTGFYVYVNDPLNLLVPSAFPEVIFFETEYLIITCRPTRMDTTVNLFKDGVKFECHQYFMWLGCIMDISAAENFYGKSITCLSYRNEIVFNVPNRMRIQSATGLYGTEGEELKLSCFIDIFNGQTFNITWTFPNEGVALKEKRVRFSSTTPIQRTRDGQQIGLSEVTIENLDVIKDTGLYKCGAMIDHLMNATSYEILIDILNENDSSIDIYTPSRTYRQDLSILKRVAVWQVKYKGNPRPTLQWYDNFDRIITSTSPNVNKYEVETTNDYTILKIKFLNLNDTGNYTLKAYNGLNAIEKKFEVMVKGRPLLTLDSETTVQSGDLANVICNCDGYPPSLITWTFRACTSTEKPYACEKESRFIREASINTTSMTPWSQMSLLTFNTSTSGYLECTAVNTHGSVIASSFVEIVDMETPFQIWGIADATKIFVGDNVTVTCSAGAHRYVEVNWYMKNVLGVLVPIESNGDDLKVESCDTKYSYRKKISWVDIKAHHSGGYECVAHFFQGYTLQFQTKSLKITVNESQKPQVDGTSPEQDETVVFMEAKFQLICNIFGSPDPTVEWYKNDKLLERNARIGFSGDNKTLLVKSAIGEDEGEFKCVGINRFGSAEKSIRLRVKAQGLQINTLWIIALVGLLSALIMSTVYLYMRLRRHRSGLEGKVGDINPYQPLHEQAGLLPYNKKFEFKKEKLKLGRHLGAGAFGVVLKGLATGILPNEEQTTVAVKILKQTADIEELRALVTELKIMVHLGQHLNVVNLLGAVTKNIANRKIMVIVEYCRFGNVQNFLIKHRRHFVDQINPENGSIDPTILAKNPRHSDYSSVCEYDSGNSSGRMDSGNTITTRMTETSDLSILGKDAVASSNNSNKSIDYNDGPMRCVTTTDLLCWLFQVARGMDYLASRKVLHGDLAARNILLCDDNVVKICDFGLARSMYKSSIYKKEGRAPLPFKWLAIESIRDFFFSTSSDVWAFGVVMWELFSLGAMPYPGMEANEDFFHKLRDGYRMDRPKNATREIYDIMLHCWNHNPESRPSFKALEGKLKQFLEYGVAEHYIDMNQQYVEMNAKNLEEGQTDYIPLMASPEGIPSSICDTEQAVPGYMPMEPIKVVT